MPCIVDDDDDDDDSDGDDEEDDEGEEEEEEKEEPTQQGNLRLFGPLLGRGAGSDAPPVTEGSLQSLTHQHPHPRQDRTRACARLEPKRE
ncbi:hypothetical protein PoB_003646700 [Plakobranchus ocellatus]|uniref:Uncharacterized protein n=1 Tax=Plakobranchus ocellatus TaxID=259542 RepID=A0AAV4ASS0_9GAST|nr:hypothetical protein PoB_003646700 [Plakobranchus ocellatus]